MQLHLAALEQHKVLDVAVGLAIGLARDGRFDEEGTARPRVCRRKCRLHRVPTRVHVRPASERRGSGLEWSLKKVQTVLESSHIA